MVNSRRLSSNNTDIPVPPHAFVSHNKGFPVKKIQQGLYIGQDRICLIDHHVNQVVHFNGIVNTQIPGKFHRSRQAVIQHRFILVIKTIKQFQPPEKVVFFN
jgi:hypothetical protein